jgi:hypothetical protein
VPLFQIALQQDLQLIRIDTIDLSSYFWLFWIPIAVFVFIVAIFFLRWFLCRTIDASNATFKSKTLLITLPKFRREEESERGPQKEQVQEAISAAEAIFASIGGLKAQCGLLAWFIGRGDELAFEIIAEHKLIKFYVTIPVHMQSFVEQQLSAAYPDAFLEEVEDYNIFTPTGTILGSYVKFVRPNAFPIKTYRKLDQDPLNSITNVLSKIPEGDAAAFQFMVRSSRKRWRRYGVDLARRMQQGVSLEDALKGKKKGEKSKLEQLGVTSGNKNKEPELEYRLSPQEEEIVKGLQEKASKAGLDVSIRLVTCSQNPVSAETILQNMLNVFSQYNVYEYGNSFVKQVPRSKKNLTRLFIYRTVSEKYKIVMNSEELASLWHLPLPWTETPNIKWLSARSGAVPANVPRGHQDGDLELGFNVYRGIKTSVWMKGKDRTRHMYLIGKSGSGKSQTIAKYAIQDIQAGHGVAVVDPHGDLIEQILGNIPRERVDDVIVFNPSDLARPMGLNMLEAKDESMKDFAAQEMVAIFYKLFPPEMIGPMFEHHMRNVMLTLMSDPENPGTIAEIPRMFSDADFQKIWRTKIKDPVVQSYWNNEVDKTSDFHKSEMLGYLISKVGRFVENEMMRNIIGQTHSSFDFREIMDKKKILLVNLSKGKTGDVNAELLGLIVVSKLQMAALTRADIPEEQRHDFFLYIDEFQNFITDSIATILSEARKYRLNLIIAHQYIGQLVRNNDTKIRDAVFGNVGTTFVARIGPEDVEMLEKIYTPDFSGYDLMNSDKFTWYVRMIVDNSQVKPFTMNVAQAPEGDRELAEGIKELSRLKFGRDRRLVEADIMERMQMGVVSRVAPPPMGGK